MTQVTPFLLKNQIDCLTEEWRLCGFDEIDIVLYSNELLILGNIAIKDLDYVDKDVMPDIVRDDVKKQVLELFLWGMNKAIFRINNYKSAINDEKVAIMQHVAFLTLNMSLSVVLYCCSNNTYKLTENDMRCFEQEIFDLIQDSIPSWRKHFGKVVGVIYMFISTFILYFFVCIVLNTWFDISLLPNLPDANILYSGPFGVLVTIVSICLWCKACSYGVKYWNKGLK